MAKKLMRRRGLRPRRRTLTTTGWPAKKAERDRARLHRQLTERVEVDPLTYIELQALVETVTRQRDQALQQLIDRDNLNQAIENLAGQGRTIAAIADRLLATVGTLKRTARAAKRRI